MDGMKIVLFGSGRRSNVKISDVGQFNLAGTVYVI
jgi:hypothetical protein